MRAYVFREKMKREEVWVRIWGQGTEVVESGKDRVRACRGAVRR